MHSLPALALLATSSLCFFGMVQASSCIPAFTKYELTTIKALCVDKELDIANCHNAPGLPESLHGLFYEYGNPLPVVVTSFANGCYDECDRSYTVKVYGENIQSWEDNCKGISVYHLARLFKLHLKYYFNEDKTEACVFPDWRNPPSCWDSYPLHYFFHNYTISKCGENEWVRRSACEYAIPESKLLRIVKGDGCKTCYWDKYERHVKRNKRKYPYCNYGTQLVAREVVCKEHEVDHYYCPKEDEYWRCQYWSYHEAIWAEYDENKKCWIEEEEKRRVCREKLIKYDGDDDDDCEWSYGCESWKKDYDGYRKYWLEIHDKYSCDCKPYVLHLDDRCYKWKKDHLHYDECCEDEHKHHKRWNNKDDHKHHHDECEDDHKHHDECYEDDHKHHHDECCEEKKHKECCDDDHKHHKRWNNKDECCEEKKHKECHEDDHKHHHDECCEEKKHKECHEDDHKHHHDECCEEKKHKECYEDDHKCCEEKKHKECCEEKKHKECEEKKYDECEEKKICDEHHEHHHDDCHEKKYEVCEEKHCDHKHHEHEHEECKEKPKNEECKEKPKHEECKEKPKHEECKEKPKHEECKEKPKHEPEECKDKPNHGPEECKEKPNPKQ